MSQIWWCVVYDEGKLERFDFCDPAFLDDGDHSKCGPRILVDPSDAETVLIRKQDGEWPAESVNTMARAGWGRLVFRPQDTPSESDWANYERVREVNEAAIVAGLDALAAASKEQT